MTRAAFDMAAFLWTGLLAGKDKENGYEVQHEDKTVYVNSAQHGYDNAMGMMDKVMRQFRLTPHQCILVFEGLHSKKRRQAIDPIYKANRDSRPPQAYEEYQKAIAMVERQWLDVGAISMRQPFVEGDDVLAYVALHSEDDIVIATYDNDMSAAVGTNPQGKRVQVWVNDKVNHNKYGDFDFHLITLYKALVGDDKDNIKGCKGFGEKSWEIFRGTYGDEGLQTVYDRLKAGALGDLHAQAEEDKLIRMLCEQEAHVIRQFQLAQLHPEWVNTRSTVLEINAGMCKPLGPLTDHRLDLCWWPQSTGRPTESSACSSSSTLPSWPWTSKRPRPSSPTSG
jgi:5'-3' exonuclease